MNGNTIHQALPTTSAVHTCGWREFCELHASATARELAKHYRRFASECPEQDVVPPDSFSRQFSDVFQEHFCLEVAKQSPTPPHSPRPPLPPPALPPPPPPSPRLSAMTGRLRITSFSGALDYREAGRPGGGGLVAGLSAKPEPESLGVALQLEQPLTRCCPLPTADTTTSTARPTRRHSLSLGQEPVSSAERRAASERYTPPPRHAHAHTPPTHTPAIDVTHFSTQLRRSVRRIFKKRPQATPDDSATASSCSSEGSGDTSNRPVVPVECPLAPTTAHNLAQQAVPLAAATTHTSTSSSSAFLGRLASKLRAPSVRKRAEVRSTCKEGQLKYLLVNDTISDSQPRWQRCRLLVRRTSERPAPERYQLELYDPPKVSHDTPLPK